MRAKIKIKSRRARARGASFGGKLPRGKPLPPSRVGVGTKKPASLGTGRFAVKIPLRERPALPFDPGGRAGASQTQL